MLASRLPGFLVTDRPGRPIRARSAGRLPYSNWTARTIEMRLASTAG